MRAAAFRVWKAVCLLLLCVGRVAYGGAEIESIPYNPQDNGAETVGDTQLYVRFTGTGGVYIATQGVGVLGDPYYSNTRLGALLTLRTLTTDESLLDRWLPNLEDVAGIVVGHGHYDHLADVPSIMARLPTSAKLVASKTSHHMVAPLIPSQRRIDANRYMASQTAKGEWIQLHPRVRVLPIQSEHSPHVAGIVFASDRLTQDRGELPTDVTEWHSGTTLSYVIDMLDMAGKDVIFRVFYQSSASSFPVGALPQWIVNDAVPVDLAILCAANYTHVDRYPEGVLTQSKPPHVMLIHWETFWDEYIPGKAVPLPGLDMDALSAAVTQALPSTSRVYLPQRGASVTLSK